MARNQIWGPDVMDLDRDDSPATVRDHSDPAEVIDMDALDNSPGLNQDDFMTDEDFEAMFGRTVQAEHRSTTTRHKIIEALSMNGNTYKRGKTVELRDGDFLRVSDILEDRQTKEVVLCGRRLRRASKFRGLFDQHLNEVVILVEHMERESLELQEAEAIHLSDGIRLRELVVTNEAYPTFSFKQNQDNLGLSRATARESCRLVCRWKVIITYQMKAGRKACVEMSVSRLRTDEADHNYRARDSYLREEWRGTTVLGGSCPSWLQGEKEFDAEEQRCHQEGRNMIDLTVDTAPHPQKQRYTFGDAFCGAGGTSRGAKSAGFRVDWGFDFDTIPLESYRRNFFAARCEATPADVFVNYIGENYVVDVLHLSPPCKTFSPIHTRIGRDDDMNSASFFAVEEVLKKTKPRIVTMENTFGLVERWREWLNSMVRFFTSLGFSIRWKVLNLAEYGLAQARRRLIVFAACPGETLPDYPPPTYGPGRIRFATINDAIRGIPDGFPNHNIAGAPKRNGQAYNGNLPLRNCITTAGSLDNTHPSGGRSFTDRELACLQGFPLEHKFAGSKMKMQIGNAVPPLVAKILFAHIRRFLERMDGPRG
ncbi:MAG: hypothetical protein Q9170_004257 [Blastenia crenularia]